MDKIKATVVLPILNEARNLPTCLDALSDFDEVVAVDSGSTDGSAQLVEAAGHRVIQFRWDGRFPKKRNWYLLNHRPSNDWVLFLDADEVVTPQFRSEVRLAVETTELVGFWIRYTNYFHGKELRFGVPQQKLALIRYGSGLYERIEEDHWSSLDMEVHEHPVLQGEVGHIESAIDHRDMNGVARFIRKHLSYAEWEVERAMRLRSSQSAWAALTVRQRIKYRSLGKPWFAWAYFVFTYVVRAGFLDGIAGLQYALGKRWYFSTIRALMIERGRSCRT